MSKPFRPFPALILAFAITATFLADSYGQQVETKIEIAPDGKASVTGRFSGPDRPKNPRSFAFERLSVGVDTVSKRVSDLELFDDNAQPVTFRKLIEGEFLADRDITAWRYKMDLSPLRERAAAAHYSWIDRSRGILVGRDLLPLSAVSGRVIIEAHGVEPIVWTGDAIRESVAAVGNTWTKTAIKSSPLVLFLDGQRHFDMNEAATMIAEIYASHFDLFRQHTGPGQVLLAQFPVQTPPGHWEAETQRSTVTIVSSDMPFRTQSLQRLHEQLRHELFHLWIPNGVNLTGSYDWFYEGFALYRSLKLAVSLNRIRFEDFLDTLSRAHTLDSAYSQRTSLIQASANRFSGASTQVYARGMLVAFLIDLELMRGSKGKKSVEDVLRGLFEKHRKPAEPVDGNTAILGALKASPELVPVIEKYISGAKRIDWAANISVAGIEDSDAGPITVLRVKGKPSGREKTLLDKLGYNNWRKLSPNSK